MKFEKRKYICSTAVSLACVSALVFATPLSAFAEKIHGDRNGGMDDSSRAIFAKAISQAESFDERDLIPDPVNGLIYNGKSQTLVNGMTDYALEDQEGVFLKGTILYSLEKDGSYSAELPQAVNAGSYTIWYKNRTFVDGVVYDSDAFSLSTFIAQRTASITPSSSISNGLANIKEQSEDGPKTITVSGDFFDFEGGVEGHAVQSVDVTYESNEESGSYKIIPSNAVIVNTQGDDVSKNYNLSYSPVEIVPSEAVVESENMVIEIRNELEGVSFANTGFSKEFVKKHLSKEDLLALEQGKNIEAVLIISEDLYSPQALSVANIKEAFENYAAERDGAVECLFSIKMTLHVEGEAEKTVSAFKELLDFRLDLNKKYPVGLLFCALDNMTVGTLGDIYGRTGSYSIKSPGSFGFIRIDTTSSTLVKANLQKERDENTKSRSNPKNKIQSSDSDKDSNAALSTSMPKTGDQVLALLIPAIIVLLVVATIVAIVVIFKNRKEKK